MTVLNGHDSIAACIYNISISHNPEHSFLNADVNANANAQWLPLTPFTIICSCSFMPCMLFPPRPLIGGVIPGAFMTGW